MFIRNPMLITTLLVVFLAGGAGATTWRVPADQPTIAAGLAAATDGDTVQIAPGTYFEYGLLMPDGVVLRGETGQYADVVIDAQQLGRVLFCANLGPATAVEDLTITGGLSDGEGSDHLGGGVLCDHSALQFRRCAILGNHALVGGGMSLRYDSDVLIEDCLFGENTAVSSGGALRIYQCAPTIRRCRFIENVVEMDGAGIFSGSSALLLEDSLFQGNEAGIWGGALLLISPNEGDLVVRGCTIVDNICPYSGSALFAANECPFTLENCLIVGNLGSEAVYVHDDPAYEAIACNNVFDNADGNYGGNIDDLTGLDGNISQAPQFCDPASGDFSLNANSPCLPANNGCNVLMGALGVGCDFAHILSPAAPAFALAAHPNPFNPATVISFELPEGNHVRLSIHSLDGRLIAVLVNSALPAGGHQVSWQGQDGQGRLQPAGVYLCQLDTPSGRQGQKLTLIP